MCFFEELDSKLCLQLDETKFDSWDVKEPFSTLIASRDSCHNCPDSLTSDLKV